MRKQHLILLFAWLLLLGTSCKHQVFYSDIQSIAGEKWSVDKPLTFTVNIEDSMQYFNMYIHLRNTTDFETQNFYVFMRTTYPDGHAEQDTLGFILCDPYGKWTGKGHGYLKENQFLFKPKVRFARCGTYTFKVQQAMREESLPGIAEFGIALYLTEN